VSTPDGIADALIIHMDWKRFCLDSIESNLFFYGMNKRMD